MRERNVWQVDFFRWGTGKPPIDLIIERALRVENLEGVLICNKVVDPVPYLCASLERVRILKVMHNLPPGKSSKPFFTTTPAPPGWLVAPAGVCGSDIFG
jgi:hypothetical protein